MIRDTDALHGFLICHICRWQVCKQGISSFRKSTCFASCTWSWTLTKHCSLLYLPLSLLLKFFQPLHLPLFHFDFLPFTLYYTSYFLVSFWYFLHPSLTHFLLFHYPLTHFSPFLLPPFLYYTSHSVLHFFLLSLLSIFILSNFSLLPFIRSPTFTSYCLNSYLLFFKHIFLDISFSLTF